MFFLKNEITIVSIIGIKRIIAKSTITGIRILKQKIKSLRFCLFLSPIIYSSINKKISVPLQIRRGNTVRKGTEK